MEVKKKDMKKSNWSRCLEKEYSYKKFEFEKFKGIVSISKLKKLTGPLTVHYDFGDVLIADDNYTHLQFAFENENFWLTAMYDNNDNLIELYFDITNGNYFDEESNPYFYDIFLDIVVTREEKIYIVDKDELKAALDEGTISIDDYNGAIETSKSLYEYLEKNKHRLIEYCYQCLQEMK